MLRTSYWRSCSAFFTLRNLAYLAVIPCFMYNNNVANSKMSNPSSPAASQGTRNAFVSWSGGKDSALACYLAMNGDRLAVKYLLTMLSETGTHSRSHHLSVDLLEAQAAAVGVPLVRRQATWQRYEEEFMAALAAFKEEDVLTGIFGDIDVQEHREWVQRVCGECGVSPILPLWRRPRGLVIDEFVKCGFRAIVVAVKLECMGREWLGREIDGRFIEDMKRLPQVDLCGEEGEYHTFVYDGPIFNAPVEFTVGQTLEARTHAFIDVSCVRA